MHWCMLECILFHTDCNSVYTFIPFRTEPENSNIFKLAKSKSRIMKKETVIILIILFAIFIAGCDSGALPAALSGQDYSYDIPAPS